MLVKLIETSAHEQTFKLPEQSAADKGKLTVVLDLDYSLIAHEIENARTKRISMTQSHTAKEAFVLSFDNAFHVIHKRPGLDDFLVKASEKFELVVFSTGDQYYVDGILGFIDPHKRFIRHRFTRDNCELITGTDSHPVFAKDLELVNRALSRTVLIDDSVESFLKQPSNGILAPKWPSDSALENNDFAPNDDHFLTHVLDVLDKLAAEADVRPALQKMYSLESKIKELPEEWKRFTNKPTKVTTVAPKPARGCCSSGRW